MQTDPITGEMKWVNDGAFNIGNSLSNISMQPASNSVYNTFTNQPMNQSALSTTGSGTGAPGYNLGNLYGALPQNYTGTNGANLQQPGWGGLALGAFNAYNAWNQGNKMYDLQKEAFDFSKEQFWDNFLMNRDKYNRLANRSNMLAEKWNHAGNTYASGNTDPAAGAAWSNEMYNKYQVPGGEHIVSNDGRTYNIVDVPGQYVGQGYGGSTQPQQSAFNNISQTPARPVTAIGDAVNRASTMDSTNPNATQNQPAKPTTADARKSAFNKRKLGV